MKSFQSSAFPVTVNILVCLQDWVKNTQ